jgi:hypothetical protein
MLEELNIRPRTLFMAKVANFHPKLAADMKQGAHQAGTIPVAHAVGRQHVKDGDLGNGHGTEQGGGH